MQLDTVNLKARIELEVKKLEEQKENLRLEIQKLDSEQDRLHETFEAVEAVERIAEELEVLASMDEASDHEPQEEPFSEPEPEQEPEPHEPAYAETPGDRMIQDFKQWA